MDVEPFIRALENMTRYYTDRNVDLFKDAVSGKKIVNLDSFYTNNFKHDNEVIVL